MKRLFYSLLILLVTVTAYGQAGSLDLSFGGTGKVITPIGVGEGITSLSCME